MSKASDLSEVGNFDEKVGTILHANESFKRAIVSLSHNEISLDDLHRLEFKILSQSECARYQKVAQKQRKNYQDYMKNKRHINTTELQTKKRNMKEARKLSE